MVTTIPAHPAHVIGCKAQALKGATSCGTRFSPSRMGVRINQLTGIRVSVFPSGGIVIGTKRVKPTALKTSATRKPAIGPFAPISKRASLFGGSDFCMITAPSVPSGGGPGMK